MTDLHARAKQAGIALAYNDIWGDSHEVPEETLRQLLEVLGEGRQEEENGLPPVKIIPAERPIRIRVPGIRHWELLGDDGAVTEKGEARQQSVVLAPLKMGYYRLRASGLRQEECLLIVAPPCCWMPEEMEKGRRVWGIAAQLYALRSKKNFGLGDFSDLRELVKDSAALGADVVGLNPLHALFDVNPEHFSPYAPSNRLFLNTLYIDVTAIQGFAQSAEAQALWNDPSFQERLTRARETELVDYPLVASLKGPVLRALHAHFTGQGENENYNRFCEEGGVDLYRQAVFDALCAHFKQLNGQFTPWRQWPDTFQHPDSPEVQEFAAGNAHEVGYYLWLQWIANAQLGAAQQTALSKGMQVGLYRDLAVGSDKAGAEIWMDPAAFIPGFSVGAPPDEYNLKGQNWGLPALHPLRLKESGYAAFIRMLRANMRHCRALRIDHAFGLSRLFLIPDGKDARDGAYLHYPFEEMLAVLRLESHLQQCIVIGEDLGTFPPGYKEGAAESGVFSYKLLYFEREEKGYTPPQFYPARSLATLSTHDLPSLKGWLQETDIDEREKLDLYPKAELVAKDRAGRRKDRQLLAQAMQREGLGDGSDSVTLEQVQRYLCKSPASIVMTQLEDVLGVATQANLPATTTERPNWRIKLTVTLEKMLQKNGPLAAIASAMNAQRTAPLADIPRATYRLQFHKDFTFHDAARILPYLAGLGISHVYASPYLKARPGSMHGYDIVDHRELNPELGGEEGYAVFLAALEENGLKHILDFVPNHMDVGGADNKWWNSVLEWGKSSPFAGYFDIDWTPRTPGATPKLIVPFLGDHYGDVLDKGELKLAFDADEGSFSIWYADHRFPVSPVDYDLILSSPPLLQKEEIGTDASETLKKQLASDKARHPELLQKVDEINTDINQLHALLERQHYRLAYWRTAASDINYRRFFDITNLAGMRVEVPELFDVMHARVLSLIRERKLHGLRLDHIDGLADPAGYCRRLREKAGAGIYLTVEKILEPHEELPRNWDIEGTSGYDALNLIGDVFVDARGESAFNRIYRRFSEQDGSLEKDIYDAKLQVLESALASELQALVLLLKRITAHSRYTRDYTIDTLRQALKEIIGWFPVYRVYVTRRQVSATDIKTVEWAVARARKNSRMPDISVYDAIASKLLLGEQPVQEETMVFVRKFQQLSGPVMAKGVEDTVFYRYNRLLSLNEVGGNPGRFGLSARAFHETNRRRARQWPHSMLATATHDTKRGEDMRMRLHALSEMPGEWDRSLRHWSAADRSRRTLLEEGAAPSANDQYFIYQILLGSWPFALMDQPLAEAALEDYKARLDAYMIKAMREAKRKSDWNQPNEAYEAAALRFLHGLLDTAGNSVFLERFLPMAKRLAVAGAINSFAQTTLKLTLPGVPDIYQGSEYWDLSLVDPDNRRPVDYAMRQESASSTETLAQLLTHWQDGQVKQRLIATLLAHRAKYPDLYRFGNYAPLKIKGKYARNALAFMRVHGEQRIAVLVPLYTGAWADAIPLPQAARWEDTQPMMPGKGDFHNLLTGEAIPTNRLLLSDGLRDFPCAVMVSHL